MEDRHWGSHTCITCGTGWHPKHLTDGICIICIREDMQDTVTFLATHVAVPN